MPRFRLGLFVRVLWRALPMMGWGMVGLVLSVGLMILPGLAQEEINPSLDLPMIRSLETWAPPEVQAIFENRVGTLATAPVRLDGRIVIHVAASTTDEGLTAAGRARQVERRLRAIAPSVDPNALQVSWRMDEQSNQPLIYVNEEVLMTVTSLDAEMRGSGSIIFRATEVSDAVRRALQRYHAEREPEFLWQRARWACGIFIVMLLGNFADLNLQSGVNQRRQRLQAASDPNLIQADRVAPPNTALRQTMITRQRDRWLKSQIQFLQVAQVCIALGGGFIILGLFPQSRWLQPLLMGILRVPLRFFLIVLVAYIAIRLSEFWIDRLSLALQDQAGLTLERSQRLALRLSTFSGVFKGVFSALIIGIALLAMLAQLGVRVGPLLAGAGIVGIAISLASQSLIKDIINGFLILFEDQYGVGDVIMVKGVSGFVETMNLRITQLRNEEGRLITIPNSQIDIVQNLSKEWSRVDLSIPVGLSADLSQVLSLMEQIGHEMRHDGIWGSLILEPPLLLGVDRLDHVGATIRIWIKTLPLKQWDVAREYRRRLKLAFEAANIPIGVPQQIIYVAEGPIAAGPATHHVGIASPENGMPQLTEESPR